MPFELYLEDFQTEIEEFETKMKKEPMDAFGYF
jgi:hypothetical protein